ncbi:hypothetical protein BU16DRAFT_539008 [Lophium mytilinum]|uniref:MYND-type domain-containing protein n=1 Tax=Lophium mytilinum TaxID=390894 RepID=A0A6A6QZD3_9PEZI|nr:hypothetical protein BU16DRAFT_539008 [Lophium mytilinum]
MPQPTWNAYYPETGALSTISWGEDEIDTKEYEDFIKRGQGPALHAFTSMFEAVFNQGHPSWLLRGNKSVEQFRADTLQEISTQSNFPIIDRVHPTCYEMECELLIGGGLFTIVPKPRTLAMPPADPLASIFDHPTLIFEHPETGSETVVVYNEHQKLFPENNKATTEAFLSLFAEVVNPKHPCRALKGDKSDAQFRAEKFQSIANRSITIIDTIPPEQIGCRCAVEVGNLDLLVTAKNLVTPQDPNWKPAIYYPEPEPFCPICKSSLGLRLCTGCSSVLYCSKECQRVDWKDHKDACRHIAGLKANGYVTEEILDASSIPNSYKTASKVEKTVI